MSPYNILVVSRTPDVFQQLEKSFQTLVSQYWLMPWVESRRPRQVTIPLA
jgi:hypothetical protein